MPKTIGIDVSPLARDTYTGTEWYTFNLIQHLLKAPGHERYTWLLYSPKQQHNALALPLNWHWKKLSWPLSRFWISGRLSLEMFLNAPDLLFVPANKLPKVLPKKVVTTVHDVAFLEYPELYEPAEQASQRKALAAALKKAHMLLTISETTKNALRQQIRTDRPIAVTKLSVDREALHTHKELAKRELIQNYLLAIGRTGKKKNSSYLVTLFEQLLKAGVVKKLVMIGNDAYGADETRRLISQKKLTGDVICLPWQEEQTLINYLTYAHALIIPSVAEGFSIPIVEAQTLGVPLLLSDIPVHREIAGNGACFFPLHDANNAVQTIAAFLNNKQQKNASLQRGLRNASQFSFDEAAQKTLKALAAVLGK